MLFPDDHSYARLEESVGIRFGIREDPETGDQHPFLELAGERESVRAFFVRESLQDSLQQMADVLEELLMAVRKEIVRI
jgi:hypothetical protein